MPERANVSILQTEFDCFTESAKKKLCKKWNKNRFFSHKTKLNYGEIGWGDAAGYENDVKRLWIIPDRGVSHQNSQRREFLVAIHHWRMTFPTELTIRFQYVLCRRRNLYLRDRKRGFFLRSASILAQMNHLMPVFRVKKLDSILIIKFIKIKS